MVSSFYPVFSARDPESCAKFFQETMNMEIRHHFSDALLEYYVLEDANGNHLDVVKLESAEKAGLYGMRMNVSDFDAAIAGLEAKGFQMFAGPIDFPKFVYALMTNPDLPNNPRCLVFHHKKG